MQRALSDRRKGRTERAAQEIFQILCAFTATTQRGIPMLHYDNHGWSVTDTDFNVRFLGKTEAVMALGNGYLGLRSTHEEDYPGQTRGFFVAGTFNRSTAEEVPELPNLPDVVNMHICIGGQPVRLERGTYAVYSKRLDLRTGELVRQFKWKPADGKDVGFEFRRFVSQDDLHLIGARVTIRPRDRVSVSISSGIDGQVTNSGAMHLDRGVRRVWPGDVLSYRAATTESGVGIAINSAHALWLNGRRIDRSGIQIDRRSVSIRYALELSENDVLTIEKISNVYTTRDKTFANIGFDEYANAALKAAFVAKDRGYDALFMRSADAFMRYWKRTGIEIDSDEPFDQLAVRFAQYHLKAMAPAHDDRMGIGPKGLTGEEYKGHSFWDTDTFVLPYFMLTMPEVAKSLLTYRYRGLDGARRKARENGFSGAMYPWEAAWIGDGEVTPDFGEIDVTTGGAMRIWPGRLEQHITSDIVCAVEEYDEITGDERFMEDCGYEMILDAALFWSSRLERDEAGGRFVIRDVIGPDEYKEHVDNNAFTNYMAKFTMDLALATYQKLREQKPSLLKKLDGRLGFGAQMAQVESRSAGLYLPPPGEDGVIPENDTYFGKKAIDLTKYRRQTHVRSILRDYGPGQINELQVTKQADVLMLMYMRRGLFSRDVLAANYRYYEPRTLHDSSLSLSVHSILANRTGEFDAAYRLFRRASEIDLGPDRESSNHGIHAAALGGVWQCVAYGFAGLRVDGEALKAEPHLPAHWRSVRIPVTFRGTPMTVKITGETAEIQKDRVPDSD